MVTDFFKKLFGKKNTPEDPLEIAATKRSDVDFTDPAQRSRFVMDCLEQMEDGSRDVELLGGEYQLLTDYLTDTEEIEALPENKKAELEQIAKSLSVYESEIKRYNERKTRMSDIDYYTLKKQESEVEEGIRKIKESEKYAVLIKKDLRRLDGERQAHEFRKGELNTNMANFKGMVSIFISAYIVCMLLLVFFQFALQLTVFVGYYLATAIAAIAITVAAVKYMDQSREKQKVVAETNKIIQLQNTVKIRYVNNRKLLEFLYLKYHVENGEKLDKLWKAYQHEKEERRQFTEAQAQMESCSKALMSILGSIRVRYPERWLYQMNAILDKREMVEIRHDLILRRQKVREQIEYNKKMAETARDEIKAVAANYPEYAKEILDLVDRNETK